MVQVRAWKQLIALALCLDIALAPALATARIADPPPRPTANDLASDIFLEKMKNTVEMLSHGQLPEFGPEDMDPNGLQGQYVNLYDHEGRITEQYFLDVKAMDRPHPGFNKLRAVLIPNEKGEKCLAFEGTTGSDAYGRGGRVVARAYLPRFCGMAAIARDKEVFWVLDNRGRLHIANYNFIAKWAFKSKIDFIRNYWEPLSETDLSTADVTGTVLTIGAVPPSRAEIPDGAIVPLNGAGDPYFTAGDALFRVNGRYWNTFSGQAARERILVYLEQRLEPTAFYNGSPEQVVAAAKAVEDAEKKYADFKQAVAQIDEKSADPRLATMVHDLGADGVADMQSQIAAFRKYAARDNDKFTLDEWLSTFKSIVINSNILNQDAPKPDPNEDRRVNWKIYHPSKYQTIEQHVRVRNESTSDKLRRLAPKYARLAAILAATGAFLTFPIAYEHSPAMQQAFLTQWMYNQWPNVLKDAVQRVPTIASCVYLAMVTFVPDLASLGAAGALAALDKATEKMKGPVRDRIRNLSQFWVNQKNWQRITTFGYWIGTVLMVNPMVRVVENVFQQKEFMSALRLGIWPGKVVSPEDPIGQFMGLDEAQTVGLTKPTLAGMIRKLKRLSPAAKDPGGLAWERARHDFKQRLQAEVHGERVRRRDYARMLAGLVVAEQYGLPYESMLILMHNRQFRQKDLGQFLSSPRAAQDWDLVTEATLKQLKSFDFEFKHSPIIHDLDVHELVKQGKAAREIAIEIKNLKDDDAVRKLKLLGLRAKRRAFLIWQAALNQGKAEAEYLRGVIANEDVSRNVEEFFKFDHIMVSVLPEVMNPPFGLPSRANLADPSQLAARSGAFLNTTDVHLQDVGFNATVHGALGTVMDGLQYEVVTAEEETIFTPREEIEDQVWARDGDGHIALMLPKKVRGRQSLYQGYLETQGIWSAMKQMGGDLRKIDLSEQAHGYLNVSFQTIWIYMYLQFAMKMFVGHQGFTPSLIAMNFLFAASPIFYKWWGWVIKPLNLLFRRDGAIRKQRFLTARRLLKRARKLEVGSAGRIDLQQRGVNELYEMFKPTPGRFDAAYAPDADAAVDDQSPDFKSLDQMADYWLELSDRVSPKDLIANEGITKATNFIQAVGSTVTASLMLVMGTDPAHQTIKSLSKWVVASAGWQLFFINFLGPKTVGYQAIKKVAGKVKNVITGCQAKLMGSAT